MNDQKPQNEAVPTGAASALSAGLGTMTDDNARAWASMGISKDWQIKRLTDWANMLERRVAQLDPMYRAFPFGRVVIDESVPDNEVRFVQDKRTVARITNVGA